MALSVPASSSVRLPAVVRGVLTVFAAIVTAVALAVPAFVFVRTKAAERQLIQRADAPNVALPAPARHLADGLRSASSPDAPLVLSYHDIRDLRPDEEPDDIYTVTPEQFAQHMAALDRAGFTAIGSSQLAAWMRGAALPKRSVYITFDDGAAGVWRYADPIIERHGFKAAVFVITGRVGTHRPYYLNWEELRRMHRTGRWDLESHTRLGHDRIPIDANGERAPFLINRGWVEREGRQETAEEVITRVTADIRGAKRDFRANGLPTPRFFAYPFSAETKPTNDASIPPQVAKVLAREHTASLSNDEPDRWVSRRDKARRTLSRVEVFRFTTAAGLLKRAANARPLPPGMAPGIDDPANWADTSGRRFVGELHDPEGGAMAPSPLRSFVDIDAEGVAFEPGAGRHVSALFAPGRTEDWTGYRVRTNVTGLGTGGTTATLGALAGSSAPVELTVSASYARLEVGGKSVAERRLPPAGARRLEVRVEPGAVTAAVDSATLGTAPLPKGATGGFSLGASGDGSEEVTFGAIEVGGWPAPPEPEPAPPDAPAVEARAGDADDEGAPARSVRRRAVATTTTTSTTIARPHRHKPKPPPSTTSTTAPTTSTTAPTETTTTTTAPPETTTSTTEPKEDDERDDGDRWGDGDRDDPYRDGDSYRR